MILKICQCSLKCGLGRLKIDSHTTTETPPTWQKSSIKKYLDESPHYDDQVNQEFFFCLNKRKKNLEEENLKENLEAYQME